MFILIAGLFYCMQGMSQTINAYNLNTYNGLPDDLVYRMITDKLGYLWICTPKGVARYNGYELRIFNLEDGIKNDDVFDLFADRHGKIWLGSISEEIGYLYNETYHKAAISGLPIGRLYPKFLCLYNNRVCFISSVPRRDGIMHNVLIGENDSFTAYKLLNTVPGIQSFMQVSNNRNLYYILGNTVAEMIPGKIKGVDTLIAVRSFTLPDSSRDFFEGVKVVSHDNFYALRFLKPSQTFLAVNCRTAQHAIIDIGKSYKVNENLQYLYPDQWSHLYAITDHCVLKFDSNMHLLSTRKLSGLSPEDGSKVKTICDDKLWGTFIGTTSKGAWVNFGGGDFFHKKDIELTNYLFKGGNEESGFFWWNAAKHRIARVKKGWQVDYHDLPNANKISAVDAYAPDTLSIAAGPPHFFLQHQSKIVKMPMYLGAGVFRAIRDSCYLYCIAGYGFYRAKIGPQNTDDFFTSNRYEHLAYDSFRRSYWAFEYSSACIFNKDNNSTTFLTPDSIAKLGIGHIEDIRFEKKYGSIFIKGNTNIVAYDPGKGLCKQVLPNYNFKGASIMVCNDMLIIAGRLGVMFCRIRGRNKLSDPVFYQNIKDLNYRSLYSCQVGWGSVLLNTDKGVFEVNIPTDSAFAANSYTAKIAFRFIVNNGRGAVLSKSGDTQEVDQARLTLLFDAINPQGCGKLRFACQSAGMPWTILNSNELVLPATLEPDTYYPLRVRISDNNWVSEPIDLWIYIRPHWWQTHNARRAILASSILITLLLFLLAVLVTRRMVIASNRRKNLQMELELKAIYAQINPHFIFNSLNSALLLIRKGRLEEAYEHVSQFSRLLRSYIRSSRNKLISISEEIANLRDYLELQTTRFADRFIYIISIEESIDPAKVKIPALLIQPFVENALNHGLLPRKEPGSLTIIFRHGSGSNELVCTIDDDGIGRNSSRDKKEKAANNDTSYGDLLIQDLVDIFNRYEEMNIEIKYTDKEPPLTGTTVTIFIKNPHYD